MGDARRNMHSADEHRPSLVLDTGDGLHLSPPLLADADAMHVIFACCTVSSWQHISLSCRTGAHFFKNTTLWGQVRIPTRNHSVRRYLDSRFKHISKEFAEKRKELGEDPRLLSITCEGVLPQVGASSLVNVFCGARPESKGEIRKRRGFVELDGELCEILVKEKKARATNADGHWRQRLERVTPFSGAFYESASTALIVIDLAGPSEQLEYVKAKIEMLQMLGAESTPKLLLGTRSDIRSQAAATGDVISYDEITQFCQLHEGLIFAETSAAREILSGSTMQLPEQLEAEATKKENALEKALQEEIKRRDEIAMVDVEFERDSDENGVIPLSDCDYPFLLAVLMGTEPSFTRDMVHSCCV